MRALTRTAPGKSPKLDPSHPLPTPSPTAYRITTKATALTRGELTWPEPLEQAIPVPGYDVAGRIQRLPTGLAATSPRFHIGDEVYALTAFTRRGNAREVTEALEEEMALKPRNMGFEEAASVPLSALSAWQALFVHGKLDARFEDGGGLEHVSSGKRVLVTAASGGVGIWGVQLARQAGADVVGTCGPSNVEFVRGLGVEVVLDYSKTDIVDWVNEDRESRGFDVVLDCVGGSTLEDAWKCARKGGIVISVAEPPAPTRPAVGVAEEVEGVWFIVSPNGAQLARITRLIEAGRCKGVVDRTYQLEEWKDAFDRVEGGHTRGKMVLRL